jgi:hypothetical protein
MKHSWWKISVAVILVAAIVAVIAQKQQQHFTALRESLASSTNSSTVRADAPVKSGDVCQMPVPNTPASVPARGNGQPASANGMPPVNPPRSRILPAVKLASKVLPKLLDVGASQLGVKTIPTQIFYDQHGKEFARHIGIFPKEDILTTFAKQGITLAK